MFSLCPPLAGNYLIGVTFSPQSPFNSSTMNMYRKTGKTIHNFGICIEKDCPAQPYFWLMRISY